MNDDRTTFRDVLEGILWMFSNPAKRVSTLYKEYGWIQKLDVESAKAIVTTLENGYLKVIRASIDEMVPDTVPKEVRAFFDRYESTTGGREDFVLSRELLGPVKDDTARRKKKLIQIGTQDPSPLVVREGTNEKVMSYDSEFGLSYSQDLWFPTIWHVPVLFAKMAGVIDSAGEKVK